MDKPSHYTAIKTGRASLQNWLKNNYPDFYEYIISNYKDIDIKTALYMYYNEIETNVDNYILDLGGKTIEKKKKNQSICLDNDFGSTVIITGEGTIKRGRDSVVYRNNFRNINDVYITGKVTDINGKYHAIFLCS